VRHSIAMRHTWSRRSRRLPPLHTLSIGSTYQGHELSTSGVMIIFIIRFMEKTNNRNRCGETSVKASKADFQRELLVHASAASGGSGGSGGSGDFECQLKIRKASDNQMLQLLLPNMTEDESKIGDQVVRRTRRQGDNSRRSLALRDRQPLKRGFPGIKLRKSNVKLPISRQSHGGTYPFLLGQQLFVLCQDLGNSAHRQRGHPETSL
jgi:hypothetical protein